MLWSDFARLVCHRFTRGGYENLEGQFNKLVQKGRVDEYITQFEELKKHIVVQNPNLSELYFVNSFLSGLKDGITSAVYLHKPLSLKDAREKARAQECVIEAMEKRGKISAKPSFLPVVKKDNPGYFSNSEKAKFTPRNSSTNENKVVKKLSYADFKDRMSKGLCIHCEEKYTPGHNCKNKQLFMLMSEEAEIDNSAPDGGELSVIREAPTNEVEVTSEPSEVSIHALTGTEGVHAVTLLGMVNNTTVSMLVDSGSTHNFISQAAAKRLGLHLSLCTPVEVTVANGAVLACTLQVDNFCWEMAGETFRAKVLVLPIGGYDVILGVHWMKMVSPVVFDFQNNSMVVLWQKKRITLNHSTEPVDVKFTSSKENKPVINKGDTCFLIQIRALEVKGQQVPV